MTLAQFRAHIAKKQSEIYHESDDDQAAWEYSGELESILDAIDQGKDVKAACEWVGEAYLVQEVK